jgi:hypothetical protein
VRKRDAILFEIVNNGVDEIVVVGTVKFSLNSIKEQNEYDLELVIPENNNPKKNLAKIIGKIRFIWSHYNYYQDLHRRSENMLKTHENNLQKSKVLLENLNEPLKYFNVLENKYENQPKIRPDEQKNVIYGEDGADIGDAGLRPNPNNQRQYQIADKVEDLIKTTFSI